MKFRNRFTALLLAVFICLTSLPLSVLATESAVDDPDYSHPDRQARVSLSPSRLLAALTGKIPSEAEADYADRYFDRALWYYDQIPANSAFLERNGQNVTIWASSFSYTAVNGQTVTWKPVEAVYGVATVVPLTESNGRYTGIVSGVDQERGESIQIVYTCELTVPRSMATDLISFAFREASAAENLPTAEEYAEALAKYQAYLAAMDEYGDACTAYENYLRLKDEYDKEKAEYDAYLVRLSKYEQDYTAYQAYLAAKEAYRSERAEYDRLYRENGKAAEAYLQYLQEINRIRASLYAMESLFVTPTSKKTGTLFQALQNAELIAMFESNRDTLVSVYGISSATLTHLRKTSDELNVLLRGYSEARAVSEREAFAFYQQHYDTICSLFNYLYDNMRSIMSGIIFNHICALMEVEYGAEFAAYRKWRVKNILCHIYLICLCLDDTRKADGQWSFYSDGGKPHLYYFSDLLDQNLILADNTCSSPKGMTFPDEVERVVLPDPPREPDFVAKPSEPAPVTEPTAPTPIAQPTEPAPVPFVGEPTEEDLENFAFAERAGAIIAEKKAGKLLARRESDILSFTVTAKTSLVCPIAFGDAPMVTYYNGDGSYLGSTEVAEGEPIPLRPLSPTLADDAAYTYSFLGWATTPDGRPLAADDDALRSMPKNGFALYAVYQKNIREYQVTVIPNNGEAPTVTTYQYGQLPVLPSSLKKASTYDLTYTFTGWSPTPAAVTGDVTYTANYIASKRTYTVMFVTPSGTVERTVAYGDNPIPPTIPQTYYEGCVRYDFVKWTPSFSPVTQNAEYTALYNRTVLAESDLSAPTLSATMNEYRLAFEDGQVKIDALLASAKNENRRVVFTLDGLTVTLDGTALSALRNSRAAYAALLTDTSGGVGIGFYDGNGASIRITSGVYLTLPCEELSGHPTLYMTDAAGYSRLCTSSTEGGSLMTAGQSGLCYRVVPQYTLSVQCEGGVLFADATRYTAKERISLISYPDEHHVLSSAVLVRTDTGEEYPIQSLTSLTMPAYHATLRVVFAPITYTVSFVSRGQTIFSGEYRLGDTVKEPQIVTDFEENGYRYTFIGWSSPIETVTQDTVYTAKFYAVNLSTAIHEGDGTEWAMGTVLWQIGLPVLILLMLLIVGIVFLILHLRKKSKKKKAKNGDNSTLDEPNAPPSDAPDKSVDHEQQDGAEQTKENPNEETI